MNGKSVLIFVVSASVFTFAAAHRFHDSAHAIGTIKKGGGTARHPALLDVGRDRYVLIATAGVIPPYRGNARVVFEGDPTLKATFHDSGPAVDLGIHRRPGFSDNTYHDLRPRDRVALWVRLERDPSSLLQQRGGNALTGGAGRDDAGASGQCCEGNRADETGASGKTRSGAASLETSRTGKNSGRGDGTAAEATSRRGRSPGRNAAQGPAVAFYDTGTNERLLSIPIRFRGTGGGDNGH